VLAFSRQVRDALRSPAVRFALLFLAPSFFLALIAAAKGLYLYASTGANFWSGPHAGEQVLAGPVLDGIELLRRNNVPDYRLNRNDIEVWTQRTDEGAWPIRSTPDSKYVLWLDAAADVPCTLVDRQNRISLYVCR
jgi:hypothetical protein